MTVWALLLHLIGADRPSRWMNFWDGFGSGPIAWCVLPGVYWRHHNCHTPWCFRIGHAVNGIVKCRRHMPKENKVIPK